MSKMKSMVAPFASLMGIGARAAAGARAEDDKPEDDERKQREDESDADYAKRMEELDDDEKAEQDRKDEDARRAEEDRKNEDARAADDDGDDESDDVKKAARAAERSRCARIIAHGIKVGAVRQAGVFAFDTRMSSASAIAALDAGRVDVPEQRRTSLADRMASASVPNPGAGGGNAPMSIAQQIVLAGKKRRGEV